MANALIVLTPRSGSTIASDLLAYKYNAINLDEMLYGSIRSVLYDKIPEDIKLILNDQSILEVFRIQDPTNKKQRQSFIYDNLQYHNKRVDFLKEVCKKHSVVVKYYPTMMAPGVNIIEWAIKNNFELYFLSRRSFEKQLYSYTLADIKSIFFRKAKAAGKLQLNEYAGYLNLKNTPKVVFPPQTFSIERATENIVKLMTINNLWKMYLNAYGKYGKLMYYEDTVAKGNFSQLNISNEMIQAYCGKEFSLRPSHKYSVGEQIINWQEILEIAKQYKVPNSYEQLNSVYK